MTSDGNYSTDGGIHRVEPAKFRGALIATVLAGMVMLPNVGCRLVQKTAELPGRAVSTVTTGGSTKDKVDPVEAQQNLLRFADTFTARMAVGVDRIQQATNAMDAADALRWKIALSTETCAIASGPNSIANVLDMTVYVTVVHAAFEDHWRPEHFGPAADPVLQSCRNAEFEIWQLAGKIIKTNQQEELRKAIKEWQQQNPNPENVLAARALGLTSLVAKAGKSDSSQPGSVFSLLMLDPFAGMDPAVREIAETRMFAERALFVSQRMPLLLRWHTELLSLNAAAQPAMKQLVSNSTEISKTLERFATVAEKLPDQVSGEREEILKSLQAQEQDVASLLESGTEMSDSINTTLITLDALLARLGVNKTNQAAAPKTNANPFRIQDYTETAIHLEAGARQLTELISTLDRTLGSTNLAALSDQVTPAVEKAKTSGKAVVDYAFWKGVTLVVIALLAALIYRYVACRLKPAQHS